REHEDRQVDERHVVGATHHGAGPRYAAERDPCEHEEHAEQQDQLDAHAGPSQPVELPRNAVHPRTRHSDPRFSLLVTPSFWLSPSYRSTAADRRPPAHHGPNAMSFAVPATAAPNASFLSGRRATA